MKSPLGILMLMAATAAGIAAHPWLGFEPSRSPNGQTSIAITLVIDTTGSMQPVLSDARRGIELLTQQLDQHYPRTSLKLGLVAYRDRGEAYITRQCPLGSPAALLDCLANVDSGGGGDVPEAVLDGLKAASTQLRTASAMDYRAIFLIGDAPGHAGQSTQIDELVRQNRQQDIFTHTVQWGQHRKTAAQWRRIAQLGGGEYSVLDLFNTHLESIFSSVLLSAV